MNYKNILFIYVGLAIFYMLVFALSLPRLARNVLNNPSSYAFSIIFFSALGLLFTGTIGIAAYFELINLKDKEYSEEIKYIEKARGRFI